MRRHTLYLFIQLFLLVLPNGAYAWTKLTGTLDLTCEQTLLHQLDCEYRMLVPEPPLTISATIDNQRLTVTEKAVYPWPNANTTILFLIDTSDPARQAVIEKNLQHLATLLETVEEYHHTGLASFDKSLRIEAPIGASKSQILAASKNIRAVGKTTELYRNIIKAIALLQPLKADRKVIFLFSDGLAEDKAYFHRDVIKVARDAGVVINSLGYPRSESKSVALQTIRRLSEETGGVFIEADNHFDLPSSFLDFPFENIDNGERINIDLSPAIAAGLTGSAELQLTFDTDVGDIRLKVPVKLPAPARKQTIQAAKPAPAEPAKSSAREIMPPPTVTAPIQVITRQAETQDIDLWLWYGVPAALVILIIMVLLALILLWQSKWSRKSPADSSQEYRPYAYLIKQDEMAIRYPITRTIWRIGRSKDNELTLRDNSVSRRHAEIHRMRNGKFDIVDVESVNGVYVNDEKITKTNLNEGDKVEIGDIILQFTQYSSDYSTEDSTEMQKTKAPVTQ